MKSIYIYIRIYLYETHIYLQNIYDLARAKSREEKDTQRQRDKERADGRDPSPEIGVSSGRAPPSPRVLFESQSNSCKLRRLSFVGFARFNLYNVHVRA